MNTPRDRIDELAGEPPSDDMLHAGEYVLGVLDREARTRAQARIAREPAFAALVEAWESQFAPWSMRTTPVTPGPHVWPRIRTQLRWSPVEGARRGLWNNLPFWRVATAVAAAAGIAAIVIALQPRPVPAPPPPQIVVRPAPVDTTPKPVTVLARDDGSTGWIATIDAATGKLLMVPVPSPADAQGRVHELWLIPEGQAPRSLGRVSNETTQSVSVPATLRGALVAGATLAVTLEPQAGIPHAAPTGPIVAKGGISLSP
jgi:anti-sigma-K factor RskA